VLLPPLFAPCLCSPSNLCWLCGVLAGGCGDMMLGWGVLTVLRMVLFVSNVCLVTALDV
jgi:hypothetical protein